MPSSATVHRAQALGYAAVGFGLAAIVLGLAWRPLAPDDLFWSNEDAREYAEAFEVAHEASVGPGHTHGDSDPNGGAHEAELTEAKERFQAARERLANARRVRSYTGHALAVGGAALAAVGLALVRRSSHAAPRRSDGGQ